MKKLLLLFVSILFLNASANAQNSNLIVFSEQGEKFYVILNGIKQNANPETNVKITELNQPGYKLKIIFADQQIADLDKNVMLEPGTETVLNVKKNSKGQYVLRFLSAAPIATNTAPAPNQTVHVYSQTPPPAATTVTTTTTTTTTGNPNGENVSIGMNIGGVGMGVNIAVTDENHGIAGTSTTSTTYSTTTTTSTSAPAPAPTPQPYVLPGYNGPVGCPYPMSPNDFEGVKRTIGSKSFDDSRMQIAKQVIGSNCLLSGQVKELMLLFSFENTRLDFAKYAYGYTFDLGNYYKVNDAFTFESSIDELNQYINSKR